MDDVSERIKRILNKKYPGSDISSAKNSKGLYHPSENPNGLIQLTTAENGLCGDMMLERLKRVDLSQCSLSILRYQELEGMLTLRAAVASFLKDVTDSPQDIDPNRLYVCNCVTSLLDVVPYILCDEGDAILTPAPMFRHILEAAEERPNVKILPVHVSSKPSPHGNPGELTVKHLERTYAQAVKEGTRVRALLIANPTNPQGMVYTRELILDCLHFCKKYQLHAILDEIYVSGVYDPTAPCSSIFSFREDEIPDIQRTHFLWGFAKDFAYSSSCCSVVYSWNERFLQGVSACLMYHPVSSLLQTALTQVLQDKEWLHDVFRKTSRARMIEARDVTMATLDELDVTYIKPVAGFYVWADFNKFMGEATPGEEERFFHHLVSHGVVLQPSSCFYSNEPGWFRILFTVPKSELQEGLKRLKAGCLSYSSMVKCQPAESEQSGAGAKDEEDEDEILEVCSGGGESLESLLGALRSSMRSSDWLQENTAEKWQMDNPELYQAYVEELKRTSPR